MNPSGLIISKEYNKGHRIRYMDVQNLSNLRYWRKFVGALRIVLVSIVSGFHKIIKENKG